MDYSYYEKVITNCYDVPFMERGLLLYAFKSDCIEVIDDGYIESDKVVIFKNDFGFNLMVRVEHDFKCTVLECDNLDALSFNNFDKIFC